MAAQQAAIGFSRLASVARALNGAVRLHIAASDDERAMLSRQLGLEALERLEADATLRPAELAGSLRLSAEWSAEVVQACVVTLEPIASHLADRFELIFAPAIADEASGGDLVAFDLDADDPPEPLPDDAIDVGAAVVEQLALALDPYPRKIGAELPSASASAEADGIKESPFAKLREIGGNS